jgi:rSAM/selenodomain-associated transferase 2/rSAM/selenodomain-associated transferase 1
MSQASRRRLIIFTRYPEPGKTKTRLIPVLGKHGAADLQRKMTEHIVAKALAINQRDAVSVEIHYEGGNKQLMQEWLGSDFIYRPQHPGNIGERMHFALDAAFNSGATAAAIIGSDIPDITIDLLTNTFARLEDNDLVFGPARDGGYYLVAASEKAWSHDASQIFSGIHWSTAKVLTQTLQTASDLKMSYILLDTLDDVDRPQDLHIWQQVKTPAPKSSKRETISIIIPTLNEAQNIADTLSSIKNEKRIEVIVVDGGSQDGTEKAADLLGAKVIMMSAPSKARQMNAGAAKAHGDVLLFLHADTRLPENFAEAILDISGSKDFAAGAFRLAIDSDARGLRLIETVANWRSRRLHAPYGDQAIFVTKSLFKEVGGFPDIPIMEDFELIRRLKTKGKIAILGESVKTSPRRWLNIGIFHTWLINQLIVLGYSLGISPQRLARWYRRDKGTKY